jgi:hypothetical protein
MQPERAIKLIEHHRSTSKFLRQDPLFLRGDFYSNNKWGLPQLRRCEIDITNLSLIASDHIRDNDKENSHKTVHFFVDDDKIDRYYNNPFLYLRRLAQYANVFTPDFSLLEDMPIALQIFNTFKSRWCGAYWQEHYLSIIPTVSWSTPDSFDFCFDGIEPGSIVAVSTLGNLKNKYTFLNGYQAMHERICPKQVLCFGKPFNEMRSEVIFVDYLKTTRRIQ